MVGYGVPAVSASHTYLGMYVIKTEIHLLARYIYSRDTSTCKIHLLARYIYLRYIYSRDTRIKTICRPSRQKLCYASDWQVGQSFPLTSAGRQPISLWLSPRIRPIWTSWPRVFIVLSAPYWCDAVDGWAWAHWHWDWSLPLILSPCVSLRMTSWDSIACYVLSASKA